LGRKLINLKIDLKMGRKMTDKYRNYVKLKNSEEEGITLIPINKTIIPTTKVFL